MSDSILTLTGAQKTTLRHILGDAGDGSPDWSRSYLGYRYLSFLISDYEANTGHDLDNGIETWLTKAAEINSNDPYSAANAFIRQVTRSGLQLAGQANGPEAVQKNSDLIGQNALGTILNTGEIGQLREILSHDVQAAITNKENPQRISGWGGSLNYWNLPITIRDEFSKNKITQSIGAHITGDPELWEEFIAINASALDAAVYSEFVDQFWKWSETEIGQFLRFGYGGDAPEWVKHEIFERATERGTGDSYLSDPDRIFHPGTQIEYTRYEVGDQYVWRGLNKHWEPVIADASVTNYLDKAHNYVVRERDNAVFFPETSANLNIPDNALPFLPTSAGVDRRNMGPLGFLNWLSDFGPGSIASDLAGNEDRLEGVEAGLEEVREALGLGGRSPFNAIGGMVGKSVVDFATGTYAAYKHPLRAALVNLGNNLMGAWLQGGFAAPSAPFAQGAASGSQSSYRPSTAQTAQNLAGIFGVAGRFVH